MNAPSATEPRKKILLMYITRVSGHRQATIAIQQALRQADPHVEAPTVNGFGYTYPILEKIINQAYMSVIKRTPKVWDYMYDNPKIVKNSQKIKNFLHKTSHEKIARLINRYKPDAVVCTQAFPCGMVADYKRSHNLNFKLIGVLTDFAPHSFWINEGMDYYVVPSEDSRERFIKKGVDPNIIKVYGIPMRPKFNEKLDRQAIATKLGFDLNVPTLLIMGGGQGLGPIKSILKSLDKVSLPMQIIAIVGINKKIISGLKKIAKKSVKKIVILEYANNVHELMEISTLIISKPGGMTTSECLVKGLPMLIVNPLPGQEMRNTDFLIEKGIAIRIDDAKDIGEEIEILLKSPQRLAMMKKAALENSKPNAARDIAKLILSQKSNPHHSHEPHLVT